MISKCGVWSAAYGVKDFDGKRTGGWAGTPAVLLLLLSSLVLTPLASSAAESLPSVTAPTATPADAVAAIETHYRDLADLSAGVTQKNFLKSVEKTQIFEGSLAIKRPGKLRLEYTNGQTIIIDGREVWFHSKKSSQAVRRTFKDFEQANIPVAFLLGAGTIRQDFDVFRPEADKPLVLELVPKRKGAAMKKLRLLTDRSGRIFQMTIFDRSGNTSDIHFSEVRENTGLDDQLFSFKVPKGTEVIDQ